MGTGASVPSGSTVLIAGPPASGKSFLLARSAHSLLPKLAELLPQITCSSWRQTHAGMLAQEAYGNNLLVHYDFLKQWKQQSRQQTRHWSYSDDRSLIAVQEGTLTAIVTIFVHQPTLISRTRRRIHRLVKQALLQPHRMKERLSEAATMYELLRLYTLSDSYTIYERWFDYCRRLEIPHYVVENDTLTEQIHPLDPWEREHMIP